MIWPPVRYKKKPDLPKAMSCVVECPTAFKILQQQLWNRGALLCESGETHPLHRILKFLVLTAL